MIDISVWLPVIVGPILGIPVGIVLFLSATYMACRWVSDEDPI